MPGYWRAIDSQHSAVEAGRRMGLSFMSWCVNFLTQAMVLLALF